MSEQLTEPATPSMGLDRGAMESETAPPPSASAALPQPESQESPRRTWARRGAAGVLVLFGFVNWFLPFVMASLATMTWALAAVVLGTIAQRVVGRTQGRLVTGFVTDPFSPENRSYLVQLALRLSLAGLVVPAAIVSTPRYTFTDTEYRIILWALIIGPAVAFVALQLLPTRPVSRSLNVVVVAAAAFLGFQLAQVHLRAGLDDAVDIASPIASEWIVTSGGPSSMINHHYAPITNFQDDAIDLDIKRNGRTYEGDDRDVTSHNIWDEPVLAPADGIVVAAEGDLPDWPVGQRDPDSYGNYVIIDMGDGYYVWLAHLQEGSLNVAPGDRVDVGQVIGRVGNSGNTLGPHLHVQVQDSPEVDNLDTNTVPMRITNATHIRGGTEHLEQLSQLRRNDVVRPDR